MTKIRPAEIFALAGLATLLLESCGGRVLEVVDGVAGADSSQANGARSAGVGGASSLGAGQADGGTLGAGQADGGTLGAGIGGAMPASKAGAGSIDGPSAGAVGNCVLSTQRACNAHPEDGIGTCRAGVQECIQLAGQQSAFGDCHGDVGPMTEGCGPQMPDTNCNGLPGDGDYQLQVGCTTSFNGWTRTVNVFAAPHPGTTAVHKCGTKCRSFSYFAASCDGNAVLSDEVQGFASTIPLPGYVLVSFPASSCVQSSAYASAAYDVQAPAFSFYALP